MSEIVKTDLADECIAEYNKMFTSNDPALLQSSTYTESVSFAFADIEQFIKAAKGSADTLQIKFGVYTQEFADTYGVTKGRLSLFLCTTKKGGGVGDPPHDIMNVGTLEP